LDALQINYVDWGGRETEIEKKFKKTSRCVSNLRLRLRKPEKILSLLEKTA
jgi:hypothetical protein